MKRQVLNDWNIDFFLSLEAEVSELWYPKPEAGNSAAHMGTSSYPESAACVLQSRHLKPMSIVISGVCFTWGSLRTERSLAEVNWTWITYYRKRLMWKEKQLEEKLNFFKNHNPQKKGLKYFASLGLFAALYMFDKSSIRIEALGICTCSIQVSVFFIFNIFFFWKLLFNSSCNICFDHNSKLI